MKEKVLREKWEKWLRGGIRLLMATGVCFTVVACYAPYYAPEPDGGWCEPNPDDTTQVDSINDMRAQRAAQKAKIEQMAEELHNKQVHKNGKYEQESIWISGFADIWIGFLRLQTYQSSASELDRYSALCG